MLRGAHVVLRSSEPDDVAFLHRLWDDVDTWLLGQSRPYTPESLVRKVRQHEAATTASADSRSLWMVFEVEARTVGVAGVWDIDLHNRRAQVAVTLAPEARGDGYGKDALGVLCHYAYRFRGLHRLQVETLATNVAMQRTAEALGFAPEGRLRGRDWQPEGWCDVVVYGLLADEWEKGAR